MLCRTKKVFFADYIFDVWKHVYEPAEDSFLFAEHLAIEKGERVLDMGTGCGILGIIASKNAAEVVAVDMNPYAVRCAKGNAKTNHVNDKMVFLQGTLFTPLRIEEKFDSILFNAPYLPSEAAEDDSWLDRAWAGGASGREVIDRFVCEAPKHLKQNGRIFLMQSTLSAVAETFEKFKENGLKADVVVEHALPFFEKIVLTKAEWIN
jgi:release factor glutamine methyltransferase